MAKVIFITGPKDSGKTTRMKTVASSISGCDGILTVKDKAQRNYYFQEIRTGHRYPALSQDLRFSQQDAWGRFSYSHESFNKANDYLVASDASVMVLDEVGRLENSGKGFYPALGKLLARDITLYISVRTDFLSSVVEHFAISDYEVLEICP